MRQHLDRATRNRELAHVLMAPALSPNMQPPPFDWAVVAAFYAAVHYVNAYLREKQRYEPRDHAGR